MSEFNEFIKEMGNVKPIKQDPTSTVKPANQLTPETIAARRQSAENKSIIDGNPLATENVELLQPEDLLSYKKDGVQQGVYRNLRLGKYDINSVLNLHGVSVKNARQNLYFFITDANKNNMRCVLIQHGKGLQSQPHQALLKSYINKWLRQLPAVLAFHSAQTFHGGSGSTYVLLKKSDEARLDNKERHQKRGANF